MKPPTIEPCSVCGSLAAASVAGLTSFAGSSSEAFNYKVPACSEVPHLCSPLPLWSLLTCSPRLCSSHSLTDRHSHTLQMAAGPAFELDQVKSTRKRQYDLAYAGRQTEYIKS